MAGKSGRSINNVPESPIKHMIFSWEGILVILFIMVNIFCKGFSEYYNLENLLRQMPVYLAEVFLMIPMAYILVLGEIDISVGATVCLSATLSCIMCNTGAPFIVVILTALIVGTVCGAVNGFILTQFEELPPMIVTLATQIIPWYCRDRTGKWWKYLSIQYRWLPSYWWKSRKGALHSVSGSDSCSNLCSDPWKVHFRTQGICNWYKPPHSILLRNPCKEDSLYYLHSYGNLLWTVRPVSGSIILWS